MKYWSGPRRPVRWLSGIFLTLATATLQAQSPPVAGDPAAVKNYLSGRWQGATTCGTRVDLAMQIDTAQLQGSTIILAGSAKSPPLIDARITGHYDLASGLLAIDGSVVPDDPNYCPGVKVLGKCMVSSITALGVKVTDEQTQRQHHQQERAALATSSAFQIDAARIDAGPALVGTVRGASFDCPSFQLSRADQAPPAALPVESLATEGAALARIDGAGASRTPAGAQARLTWLEAMGRRGDPISMAELGHVYETAAPGRPGDPAKAAEWYLKAANAGESRAQRRLAAMYAKGEGLPLDPGESDRWLRAAKATSAAVGRYCVAPAMIDAYMELFDAAKKDPSNFLLGAGVAIFTGMAVDEGTVRIQGAGVDEVTLPDGPFTCLVLARRVGASVRNIRPVYAYAGEDSSGRTYFYDNSGEVAMNEAISSFATQMASKVQVRQAFQVQQLGGDRLRVTLAQGLVAGRAQSAEVQIDPATLVSADAATASAPAAAAQPARTPAQATQGTAALATAGVATARASTQDAKVDPKRERAVWSLCESATTPAMCQAYLSEFPTGPHAGQARGKMGDMGVAADGAVQPASPRAAPATAPIDAAGKDDPAILAAVNGGMQLWSRSWQYDHYIGNSVRIQQRRCDGAACQVGGTFEFSRMNQRLTIPYSASVRRQRDGLIAPTRLCYDDVSTNTSDCADF